MWRKRLLLSESQSHEVHTLPGPHGNAAKGSPAQVGGRRNPSSTHHGVAADTSLSSFCDDLPMGAVRRQEVVVCRNIGVPNLLGTTDRFCGREIFHQWGWGGVGWFRDDSSTLELLCTLFLFLSHWNI